MLRLAAATEDNRDEAGDPHNWMTTYTNIIDTSNNIDVYIAALYWSGMTVTTIGYGDIGMRDAPIALCAQLRVRLRPSDFT
jgi:hypothetical protein